MKKNNDPDPRWLLKAGDSSMMMSRRLEAKKRPAVSLEGVKVFLEFVCLLAVLCMAVCGGFWIVVAGAEPVAASWAFRGICLFGGVFLLLVLVLVSFQLTRKR